MAKRKARIDSAAEAVRVMAKATTEIEPPAKGGMFAAGQTGQQATIAVQQGSVRIDVSMFLNRPTENMANFGDLRVILWRNGQQITFRDLFYDDNFAYPFSFFHPDNPPPGTHTYTVSFTSLSGAGQLVMRDAVIALTNFKT